MPFKFHKGTIFSKIKSEIKYGVEIEVNANSERKLGGWDYELYRERPESQNQPYNKDKRKIQDKLPIDWTIHPENLEDKFGYGYEITSPILQGDEGFKEIREVCSILKNFRCDRHCGLHLHLDMSAFSNEQRQKIACSYELTYEGWLKLVNKSRRNNQYCDVNTEIKRHGKLYYLGKNLDRIMDDHDKYEWVNWTALREHGTVEIRLHHGTTNPEEIRNWIILNCAFVERASKSRLSTMIERLPLDMKVEDKVKAILSVTRSSELKEFYRNKIRGEK